MERLIKQVTESLEKAGLVEVEVSDRHVHLTAEDVEALFGKGAVLHPKRPLSQKGQFLSEERVTLVGKKRKMERVAVLGPVRRDTQVELSVSDCVALGVEAPLRESGDVEGTGPIIIEGPAGRLPISPCPIGGPQHIPAPPHTPAPAGLTDNGRVFVQIPPERPVTFEDVIIRVREDFNFKMHIDFDEANAASVKGFTLGKIIKHT